MKVDGLSEVQLAVFLFYLCALCGVYDHPRGQ